MDQHLPTAGIQRCQQPGDPQAAEIAVTIVDDWQGRGLGTELLSRLSDRARQVGIHRFTALVSTDNAASVGLLRNLGARLAGRGPGTVEYELALEPAAEAVQRTTCRPNRRPRATQIRVRSRFSPAADM
jgi:GNAT superfamily N-acetyltransferase